MSAYFVHESAYVDEGAVVGEGVAIWHFTHVMDGAVIGERTKLGQNVFVGRGVEIGSGVKIQNNVSVYEGVVIEDDVFCGPSMVFTNVLTPRAPYPRLSSEDFEQTRVRRGASIGANATVVCGVTIGEWAMVGAGAVVTGDVPPHSIVVGIPGRQVGWACQCGSKLSFDGPRARCGACERVFEESTDGLKEIDDG